MIKKGATIDDVLTQLLAMHDEMTERFDSVEQRLGSIEKRLDTVEKRLDTVEKRLDTVEQRLDTVEKRLTDIECRVANFELQMDAMDYRIERLEFRMSETSEWQKKIDQRFIYMEEVLYPSFRQLQVTVRDHGTRIRRLEGREGILEEELESVIE